MNNRRNEHWVEKVIISPKSWSPPRHATTNGSHGSSSLSYAPMMSSSLPKSNNKRSRPQHLKCKQQDQSATLCGSQKKGVPHKFQFKIGLKVGEALGECFTKLQCLKNSMNELRIVSEDVADVMQCIEEQMSAKGKAKVYDVGVFKANLDERQRDVLERMNHVTLAVNELQSNLEHLDEHHSEAQEHALSQKLEEKEAELHRYAERLANGQEELVNDQAKLRRQAKKIKAREKRLNKMLEQQSYQSHLEPSFNGSDYAPSEFTYNCSDGNTETASLNSRSDDESKDSARYLPDGRGRRQSVDADVTKSQRQGRRQSVDMRDHLAGRRGSLVMNTNAAAQIRLPR